VAMLVAGFQQQLQRAEDIKNQALRSADEHNQREDHLIREVCVPAPFFYLTRYIFQYRFRLSFLDSQTKNFSSSCEGPFKLKRDKCIRN
jgi:hypothetical protein